MRIVSFFEGITQPQLGREKTYRKIAADSLPLFPAQHESTAPFYAHLPVMARMQISPTRTFPRVQNES